ncbi:MAG TPA: hypothetical protein DCP28_10620, partial [Cytophagales bacterium]|nr:hypothetical protein [Cytophagales bacterium]
DRWYNNTCHTFFALREGADPAGLEPKLAALLEQNAPSPNEASYFMHPLHDLHLTTMNAEIGSKGNAQYIRLFSLVALLILLLASVNYINLALARSLKRSREVGMRKVVGANRRQLVGQFLSESVLMASMALLLALALVHFLAPIFGVLVERPLQLNLLRNPSLLLTLGALMLGVGLLSGSYPAYLVSAFRPLQVLRGRLRTGPKGLRLDRVLMVGQFAVSVALIFGSLVIYRQFQFIQTKALGYNQEQVITLPVADAGLRDRFEAIQQTCLAHPNIVAMAASWNLPNNINSSTVINDDDEAAENSLMIYESRVTYDYLEVFGMELVSGRFFSPEHALDAEEGYVLNETAARALGWSPEEAIGQTFSHQGTETVIGVIRDFHMHTMHLAIQPLMLSLEHGGASWFSVKVRPEGLPETLAFLENTFAKHTAYPFDYQFLDDQFNQLYQAELQAGKLFGLLTLLSLIIASVGLFGMAALSAERRTQEIGIRKVLGASIQSLVGLLSADYLKLVLMGFALAVPVAGYAMHQWLMDYAYRISLSWWMFPLVGLAALLLTLLTISTHSIRSARTNPTVCLKDK